MTRSYPKSSQIVNDSALNVLGSPVQAPLHTIFSKLAQESEHPYRLYASTPPDARLYITASETQTASGAQEVVSCDLNSLTAFTTGYIDFQSRAFTANILIAFPASTVGQYRHCVFSYLADGTIKASFTAESTSIVGLPNPLSVRETGSVVLGWITLQCTHVAGSFKTADSVTNVIENSVGGVSRVFQLTDKSFPLHPFLTDLNAGVYQDGGHDFLAVARDMPGGSPSADDDISSYKTGSLFLDSTFLRGYILLDNASTAAKWKEFLFNGGNASDVEIGTTVPTSTLFIKTNNIEAGSIDSAQSWSIGPIDGIASHAVHGDLTISGQLTVNGTSTIVNSTTVEVADNQIVLNNGEVGAGVTAGVAGLVIDRGSATDYEFVFRESDDTFRVGMIGSTQAVATREDSPTVNGVPFWNNTSSRFDTFSSFNYETSTNTLFLNYLDVNRIYLNAGPVDASIRGSSSALMMGIEGSTLMALSAAICSMGDYITPLVFQSSSISIRAAAGEPSLTFELIDGLSYKFKRVATPTAAFTLVSTFPSEIEHIRINGNSEISLGRNGNFIHSILGTGALALPAGVNSHRDDLTPSQGGAIRFNTTGSVIEYYTGSAWTNMASEPYAAALAISYAIVFG